MGRRTLSFRNFVVALVVPAILATAFVNSAPARAQTTYTLGIDVSHRQGVIDWVQVAQSGHVFVFAKATEGATFTDSNYGQNRSGAGTAGVKFGAYHFARPDGSTIEAVQADATSEADYFLGVAQPAPGDLLPVLDLEATGGLPADLLTQWTQTWIDRVRTALGSRVIVYTNPNFWRTNLNDTITFAQQGLPLWIAHYTSAAAPTVPAMNWGGNGFSFWQWTNCATIPGIAGCVDEDRFPGSDLSPFTIPGAPTPEPTPSPGVPPASESPPTISGVTEVGQTLTASTGTWTGTEPQSYSYSWYRCDAAGSACSPIVGGTQPAYELRDADYAQRMKVTVTASNSAGTASSESELTDPVTDTTAPVAPQLTSPREKVTLTTKIETRWTHPDDDSVTYEARYRSASSASAFGDFVDLVGPTTQTSLQTPARTGNTYCFSARATDSAENASAWSEEECTTTPLDDRDLSPGRGWASRSGRSFYLGTFREARATGAALKTGRVRAREIQVLVQRCPECGKISILLAGETIRTVSLASRRTIGKVLIRVGSFGAVRRGVVKIVVVSEGKKVRIDGLVVIPGSP